MEHRFLNIFENGVWPRPDRIIKVNGVEHDMDEYAKEHGITLPDSGAKPQKKINTDVKEKEHADMEHKDHSRDIEVDGNGNSEG
jgi:hypothetical protein